jgi:DSBA-like thioredoxin domain
MTNVEFFFDPSCPWTWVTSRWLASVAPRRQLEVTWRTWSLGFKNEGRELPPDLPAEWRERIRASQAFAAPALRVLQAAGDEGRGRLYTELGRRFHGEGDEAGRPPGDPGELIADAIEAAGLPMDLVKAADEESWDESIRDNMDEVRRAIGDEVGVPIVALRDGEHLRAMSGPIMSEVPPQEGALALWDAVATVIREPAVFELKRHRTGHPKPPVLDARGGRA